jgi:hypothetical protein
MLWRENNQEATGGIEFDEEQVTYKQEDSSRKHEVAW